MTVYFARVKGYVKIGYSKNPESRINTITTGTCLKPDDVSYGDEIYLLGWVDGDRKVERAVHELFAELRVVGEWFWDDDAFDRFIQADPRGVMFYETSDDVRTLMREYPNATREQVEAVVADVAAKSGPSKIAAEINHAFGSSQDKFDEWISRTVAQMKAERDEDRAYWRQQRAQVAS